MVVRLGALMVLLGVIAWIIGAANWPAEVAPEAKDVAPFLFVGGLIIVIGVWIVERFFGRDVP